MSVALDLWCKHISDDLIKAVSDGPTPVVFLGAGFGNEAVPPLKGSADLAEALRRELSVNDQSIPLAELLQFYKNCHSRSDRAVRAWIEGQLNWGGKESVDPGGAHHLLLQLPFRVFLTTNYDDLLDRAASRILPPGMWCSTTTIDEFNLHVTASASSQKVCAHVHGAFAAGLTSQIVATTDDYIDCHVKQRSWLNLVEELLRRYRFIFIGYSMRDFTVWSSYFTTIIKEARSMWPHAMVSPPHSIHDSAFWSQYNIHFIPLLGYQFSIALSARLGLLSREMVAVNASAACWRTTPARARPRFLKLHKSLGYTTMELTLRHVINDTHTSDF